MTVGKFAVTASDQKRLEPSEKLQHQHKSESIDSLHTFWCAIVNAVGTEIRESKEVYYIPDFASAEARW